MAKTKYVVYVHVNKINSKAYVGISKNPEERWGTNGCRYNYMRRGCFRHAIDKYGWSGFEHLILEQDLTLQEARVFEKLYIKALNAKVPNGYNLTDGGEGTQGCSHIVSAEARQRMSELKRGKQFTYEHKKRLSEARKEYIGKYGVQKVQPNNRKAVLQYSFDGEFIARYNSATEAEQAVGLHNTIGKACNGYLKTLGGYIWKWEATNNGAHE